MRDVIWKIRVWNVIFQKIKEKSFYKVNNLKPEKDTYNTKEKKIISTRSLEEIPCDMWLML